MNLEKYILISEISYEIEKLSIYHIEKSDFNQSSLFRD